jgi:hypothetical protein
VFHICGWVQARARWTCARSASSNNKRGRAFRFINSRGKTLRGVELVPGGFVHPQDCNAWEQGVCGPRRVDWLVPFGEFGSIDWYCNGGTRTPRLSFPFTSAVLQPGTSRWGLRATSTLAPAPSHLSPCWSLDIGQNLKRYKHIYDCDGRDTKGSKVRTQKNMDEGWKCWLGWGLGLGLSIYTLRSLICVKLDLGPVVSV